MATPTSNIPSKATDVLYIALAIDLAFAFNVILIVAWRLRRKGNCWDNALAESFFASLKGDLIDRKLWPTRSSVEAAFKEYIENFYNGERRHSALNYTCPIDYEALTREAQAA